MVFSVSEHKCDSIQYSTDGERILLTQTITLQTPGPHLPPTAASRFQLRFHPRSPGIDPCPKDAANEAVPSAFAFALAAAASLVDVPRPVARSSASAFCRIFILVSITRCCIREDVSNWPRVASNGAAEAVADLPLGSLGSSPVARLLCRSATLSRRTVASMVAATDRGGWSAITSVVVAALLGSNAMLLMVQNRVGSSCSGSSEPLGPWLNSKWEGMPPWLIMLARYLVSSKSLRSASVPPFALAFGFGNLD